MSNLKIYVKSIIIPLIIGAIIGFITSGSMDYGSLKQPFLSPPRYTISNCLDYSLYFNGNILWNS